MKIEKEEIMGTDESRKILVGVRFDTQSKELLGWALVKVAQSHDHVIAVHVSRNSDDASKQKTSLDNYLEIYKSLCDIKKVKLSGKILTGKSIRKSLVKEAKESAAAAVIVGITKPGSIGGRVSTAKYCAKHLPSTTDILTVHNGKIVFQRLSNGHSSESQEDARPSFQKPSGSETEVGDSEASSEMDSNSPKLRSQDSECESTDNIGELVDLENKYAKNGASHPRAASFSNLTENNNIMEQKPGWPLLRRSSLPTQKALDSRKMSVVQWVMSFPDRSPPETPHSSSTASSSHGDSCSSKSESPLCVENDDASNNGVFSRKSSCQWLWSELLDGEPGLPFELNFLEFTWFSYEVLRHATSNFSSENLIGKGGCSQVYKGTFLDGKEVAVKVLKSSKQAWKDFSLEVNIMSSLRHKNITPLLGVCVDNSELISVYEFMSQGSLEDNLHAGESKEKSVLSWDARFKIAVGIAEALVYLHQGCSKLVIHRDVKSSNILLSDNFEPQLSDFGLAIWGPNSTCCETYTDVVGTFGYLAPEYFMYGRVTDKLDVYSFGVVLLELLSGRKPIDPAKGQESLVMWAKPMLQSGKLVLDSCLEGSIDESQMRRMVLAATLCLTRATRLRPNMEQILKLLRGEETMESWAKPAGVRNDEHEEAEENLEAHDDEEVYQNSSAKKSHLSLALLDVEDEITSFSSSSGERSNSPSFTLADYLAGRCRRSSSFD